ncbi:DUF1345 domain-containing protein [Cognatilysobacter lacus]|uniref:DUF1345 domain-containing protein n=1 Tax=Cognatilysobacter lacus TaxID=1643323 RepID=A0A5D8Z8T7_9GAMM|nr:DUF1345 domain-containing protein [Lysobacter lacus]TZF90986.1 DUF1345 domain-containing protein [Lysobacter lacus]
MHPLHKLVRARPRLVSSLAVGAVIAALLPDSLHVITRLLVGWDAAVWIYLVLMGWLMMTATSEQVRRIASQEDESGPVVLLVFSLAAAASLAAIVLELSKAKGMPLSERAPHYLLTGATVVGTWLFVATLFTFHYARMFYRGDHTKPALQFPEGELDPNFWDFLYFSFTIAAASQTADVNIMTPSLRKTALAQTVLSFFFNVAVLGFAINIAAGVVAG